MELTANNIIWSKGPLRNTYSQKQTEHGSSASEIRNIITSAGTSTGTGTSVIFIRNGSGNHVSDLELFANQLELLRRPIILITTDGDRSMPQTHDLHKTIKKILVSPLILKWYTQNYDKSLIHPKLAPFPIGFDLHTEPWLVNNSIKEKIKYMIDARNKSPTNTRISTKIFSDTHHSFTHPERRQLYHLLLNNKRIDFLQNRLPFVEITKVYNKYNFVLSPRGGGLDCHRTWELFLAGNIVITKTSSLDEMYIKNHLPVVILQDWSELNDNNLEHKLQDWYNTYIGFTSISHIFPRLTFDYWLNT